MSAIRKTTAKSVAKSRTGKTAAAKTSAPAADVKAAAAPPPPAPSVSTLASREDHFRRIQREAYYLAEKGGFAGDPTAYWLAAEASVLRSGH